MKTVSKKRKRIIYNYYVVVVDVSRVFAHYNSLLASDDNKIDSVV